jgi:hypothetical protein
MQNLVLAGSKSGRFVVNGQKCPLLVDYIVTAAKQLKAQREVEESLVEAEKDETETA